MNVYKWGNAAISRYNLEGSFGRLLGEVCENENGFEAKNDVISVKTALTKDKSGVVRRIDTVKNISNEEITLNTLASKFTLIGGEYEVYTQYSGWLNESMGAWQELNTSIMSRSTSVRNTQSADPFMCLWSLQAGRGVAFHINAFSTWQMRVSRFCTGGEAAIIEVELGLVPDNLNLKLSPGEEITLPEILYYDIQNKLDMDAYKLHSYINARYPRREMPVVYNSWLARFFHVTYDDTLKQIEKAAKLGVEYYVIDAGWYGEGDNWWTHRGDWQENETLGFQCRMSEIADAVRAKGMKFGFWLEPETGMVDSHAYKAHPEYFLENDRTAYLLDFANPEAVDYIFNITCELVDKYDAKYIKFDFNADLFYDEYQTGFIKYFEGHRSYISRLREKYPDLYIENCASGGNRLSLRDGALYDSFWLTDDQSPYTSLRVFKDTVRRLPPQWIERWATIRSAEQFSPKYKSFDYVDKIIATDDATWENVRGVNLDFLLGVLTGSPIGLSFDLNKVTDEVLGSLKEFIEKFKADREFWMGASCRILTDTKTVTTLQFSNEDLSRVEIVLFTHKIMQDSACVYPVVDENVSYEAGESIMSGKDISDNGIEIITDKIYSAHRISLKKK